MVFYDLFWTAWANGQGMPIADHVCFIVTDQLSRREAERRRHTDRQTNQEANRNRIGKETLVQGEG